MLTLMFIQFCLLKTSKGSHDCYDLKTGFIYIKSLHLSGSTICGMSCVCRDNHLLWWQTFELR
jgi:hypothetical protein